MSFSLLCDKKIYRNFYLPLFLYLDYSIAWLWENVYRQIAQRFRPKIVEFLCFAQKTFL